MSTHARDDVTGATGDEQTRYAAFTIGDDEFVVYDRENQQAWIQSTVTVDVGERR